MEKQAKLDRFRRGGGSAKEGGFPNERSRDRKDGGVTLGKDEPWFQLSIATDNSTRRGSNGVGEQSRRQ